MGGMAGHNQVVIFLLGEQRYGLALSSVVKAARMVEITPLPNAPDIVLGVINVRGKLTPVVSLRRRFHLPEREIALTDQILVAHTQRRAVALVTDAVVGVLAYADRQIVSVGEILSDVEHVEGVVILDDGLVLIHDLEKFLSLDETRVLDAAMSEAKPC